MEINDADAELHGMLGGLLRRRRDYQLALAHYRRSYELQDENLYSVVGLAGVLGALRFIADAEKLYRKLRTISERKISEGSADHWVYFCLGQAAAALGDKELAMDAYRTALKQQPPIEHVRSEVEQLEFLQEENFAAENIAGVLPTLREYLRE